MSGPFLQIEHLSYAYQINKQILNKISFDLKKGESLGILGPNGGGKSTLLKILVGLLKKQSGSIKIEGLEVDPSSANYRHYFAYLPQATEFNEILPVRVKDLLDYACLLKESATKISETLEIVGMLNKQDELISALSGGERQRVLLAKALIHGPKILVLDEPTNGLDSNGQDQLLAILNTIKKEQATAVIIVDHNINQILKHCDKILCLNNSGHWHDSKDLLTKNILESIYHCEFEHTLIHEKVGDQIDHHQCVTHGPKHNDDKEKA